MTPSIEVVERGNKIRLITAVVFVLFIFIVYFTLNAPKRFFPHDLVIPEGSSLQSVSKILKEDKLISSRSLFNILITIQGESGNIKSGTYVFKDKNSIFKIAKRLSNGVFNQDIITITIKEGHTLEGIATVAGNRLENFDKEIFFANTKEGYLFPDTYKFLEYATTEEFIERLEHQQELVMMELREKYPENERTTDDIVKIASLIEKEADTPEGRRLVSDIIHRRLEIEMPLQLDATFVYGIGKGTFDLTTKDLLEDGPYNSYVNKGLPPTAIANPGRDSLEAALSPTPSEYVFFLTGRDGEMYYAVTYEGHLENRKKFLD